MEVSNFSIANIKQEPEAEFLLILPVEDLDPTKFHVRSIKEEVIETEKEFHCDLKNVHCKRFKCKDCDKQCSSSQTLQDHLITWRHGKYANAIMKTFDCDECDKKFLIARFLQHHKVTVHVEPKFLCDYCMKGYKTKKLLKYHIFVHAKTRCVVCHKMFKKFSRAEHYKRHNKISYKISSYQCDFCSRKYKAKNSLKHHLLMSHTFGERYCNFCDAKIRKFATKSKLIEHQKIHLGKNHWKCLKCCYRTGTEKDLQKHTDKVHDKKDSVVYKCKLCPVRRFSNIADYNYHDKIHIGVNIFKCLQCNYQAKKMRYLDQHLRNRRCSRTK